MSGDWSSALDAELVRLRARRGWSSTAFARAIDALRYRQPRVPAEEARLDRYVPGWRANLPEDRLAELRVGVSLLPHLVRLANDGVPWHENSDSAAVVADLAANEQHLSAAHRRMLTQLASTPTAPPPAARTAPVPLEQLTAARHWLPQPTPPLFEPPPTVGRHPLTGKWVRAQRNTVAVDGFVVQVFEDPAEVRLWAPTTGRVRGLDPGVWEMRVIQEPQ
ncbi:hypothetical protein [Curtobacterium sp. MCBD17_040]|uniref:hypothetical protein n=1 Tax=Curtobacterium sp. MCBD17_040 TaxID=2175674 RepID=UPI0024E00B5E|nr:hypothetical protein [Curtobacterium sp. MCBD17_040]WIB65386.1 hypothetical protein DEI94_18435 [Curtobacterium sp. MCBD17_040]